MHNGRRHTTAKSKKQQVPLSARDRRAADERAPRPCRARRVHSPSARSREASIQARIDAAVEKALSAYRAGVESKGHHHREVTLRSVPGEDGPFCIDCLDAVCNVTFSLCAHTCLCKKCFSARLRQANMITLFVQKNGYSESMCGIACPYCGCGDQYGVETDGFSEFARQGLSSFDEHEWKRRVVGAHHSQASKRILKKLASSGVPVNDPVKTIMFN